MKNPLGNARKRAAPDGWHEDPYKIHHERLFEAGEWTDWVRDPQRAPSPRESDEAEIVIAGWKLVLLYSRDWITIRDRGYRSYFSFHVAGCHAVRWGTRPGPDASPEGFLSIRAVVGDAARPSELCTEFDIAVPMSQQKHLQSLAMRLNAEISSRQAGQPPVPRLDHPPRPENPAPRTESAAARPKDARPRTPRHALAPPANPLVQAVAAIGMAESQSTPVREPGKVRIAPTPTPNRAPDPVPVEPSRSPDPQCAGPPPLRRIEFVQAPDDKDWLTFCPLWTAGEIRAMDRDGQRG